MKVIFERISGNISKIWKKLKKKLGNEVKCEINVEFEMSFINLIEENGHNQ